MLGDAQHCPPARAFPLSLPVLTPPTPAPTLIAPYFFLGLGFPLTLPVRCIPRFDSGTLHCSPSTAKLAQQQLRVPSSRIVPHPLNSPFVVDDVRVTFLDANHCPGAVMVLFEPPGEGLRPVLHTGDCRLVPAMQQEAALEVKELAWGVGVGRRGSGGCNTVQDMANSCQSGCGVFMMCM